MPAGRKPTISDEEILRRFALTAAPVVSSQELAEAFDFSVQGIRYRLVDLEEEGLIASKKAGSARMWWLTEEGRRRVEDYWLD